MRKLVIALLLVAAAAIADSRESAAQGPSPFGFGFQPFGFYQPYGATYRSQLRTPPYFATNPPVYYGARNARPYGLSPFASPPLLLPGQNYRGRLRTEFAEPQVPTPGPAPSPLTNPYLQCSDSVAPAAAVASRGKVRRNPFVSDADAQVARR